MAYFKELPAIKIKSQVIDKTSSEEYATIKNFWRRAKLREDIGNFSDIFAPYQISENERPDQIAEKFYGDSELDWVILTTNNIINLNNEWPLDNNTLYEYLLEKYGSESALLATHHVETNELRDNFNRIVLPKGLQVDPAQNIPTSVTTEDGKTSYELDAYPPQDNLTTIEINLIQVLPVLQREEGIVLYPIPDINIETSKLKVYPRINPIIDVNIDNDLATFWPSGWGGSFEVYGRDENKLIIVEDSINTIYKITLTNRLYEIVEVLDPITQKMIPTFRFRYLPPS